MKIQKNPHTNKTSFPTYIHFLSYFSLFKTMKNDRPGPHGHWITLHRSCPLCSLNIRAHLWWKILKVRLIEPSCSGLLACHSRLCKDWLISCQSDGWMDGPGNVAGGGDSKQSQLSWQRMRTESAWVCGRCRPLQFNQSVTQHREQYVWWFILGNLHSGTRVACPCLNWHWHYI